MNRANEIVVSRNEALGFAIRTRKNLEYVVRAFEADGDVHVVTQLINSLLGLVVFFNERELLKCAETMSLADLESKGWPHITITMGSEKCRTLKDIVYHVRNAVAHGRIRFTSEDREISLVTVEFEDWLLKAKEPYACFSMNALDLHDFCLRLLALVETEIG